MRFLLGVALMGFTFGFPANAQTIGGSSMPPSAAQVCERPHISEGKERDLCGCRLAAAAELGPRVATSVRAFYDEVLIEHAKLSGLRGRNYFEARSPALVAMASTYRRLGVSLDDGLADLVVRQACEVKMLETQGKKQRPYWLPRDSKIGPDATTIQDVRSEIDRLKPMLARLNAGWVLYDVKGQPSTSATIEGDRFTLRNLKNVPGLGLAPDQLTMTARLVLAPDQVAIGQRGFAMASIPRRQMEMTGPALMVTYLGLDVQVDGVYQPDARDRLKYTGKLEPYLADRPSGRPGLLRIHAFLDPTGKLDRLQVFCTNLPRGDEACMVLPGVFERRP